MNESDTSDEIATAQVEDLETLERRLSYLTREADAATRIGDRAAWIGYAAIFIAIPFVVVLFRLHMQAWHYYVAGALFVAGALVTHAMELAAMAKRDKAIQALQGAQEAYEVARAHQYSRTAVSKYQVRRISTTSNSRARARRERLVGRLAFDDAPYRFVDFRHTTGEHEGH